MSNFRKQGNQFFLTYPRCNKDKDDVLVDLLIRTKPNKCVVAHELHADGSSHIHVGIEFGSRKDIKNERYFDIEEFHCNIQVCKSWKAVVNYISKEGDLTWYPDDLDLSAQEDTEGATDLTPHEGESEAQWLHKCISRHVGYGYAARLWALSKVDRGDVIPKAPEIGTLCAALEALDIGYTKPVVMTGKSGIGKSTWCMRKGPWPMLLVSHMDDLVKFDSSYHRSILFDDMSFLHMPLQAQIHLVDSDLPRSIHCRYRTARIPAGTVKYFTCNTNPFSDEEAITRRIVYINILNV